MVSHIFTPSSCVCICVRVYVCGDGMRAGRRNVSDSKRFRENPRREAAIVAAIVAAVDTRVPEHRQRCLYLWGGLCGLGVACASACVAYIYLHTHTRARAKQIHVRV